MRALTLGTFVAAMAINGCQVDAKTTDGLKTPGSTEYSQCMDSLPVETRTTVEGVRSCAKPIVDRSIAEEQKNKEEGKVN